MKVIIKRHKKNSMFRATVVLVWEENGRQFQKNFYRPHVSSKWTWWSLTDSTRKSHSAPRLKAAIASWRLTRG